MQHIDVPVAIPLRQVQLRILEDTRVARIRNARLSLGDDALRNLAKSAFLPR